MLRSVSGISRVAGLVALPPSLYGRQIWLSSPRWEGATPHPQPPEMSAVPFKANADRRHHISKQQDRVTNWSEYDAALRQREPDGVVHRRGDRGLARRTTDHAGRSTPLFGPGDHDGADPARRVPPGSAADRRADRLRHPPARSRSRYP